MKAPFRDGLSGYKTGNLCIYNICFNKLKGWMRLYIFKRKRTRGHTKNTLCQIKWKQYLWWMLASSSHMSSVGSFVAWLMTPANYFINERCTIVLSVRWLFIKCTQSIYKCHLSFFERSMLNNGLFWRVYCKLACCEYVALSKCLVYKLSRGFIEKTNLI